MDNRWLKREKGIRFIVFIVFVTTVVLLPLLLIVVVLLIVELKKPEITCGDTWWNEVDVNISSGFSVSKTRPRLVCASDRSKQMEVVRLKRGSFKVLMKSPNAMRIYRMGKVKEYGKKVKDIAKDMWRRQKEHAEGFEGIDDYYHEPEVHILDGLPDEFDFGYDHEIPDEYYYYESYWECTGSCRRVDDYEYYDLKGKERVYFPSYVMKMKISFGIADAYCFYDVYQFCRDLHDDHWMLAKSQCYEDEELASKYIKPEDRFVLPKRDKNIDVRDVLPRIEEYEELMEKERLEKEQKAIEDGVKKDG